ncbi:MAG: carboxypeptidase regulatory-like domain-containing protein [Pyrinomonadaceae bacterium]
MKTNFKFLSLVIALVFAFSASAFAQFTTGTIEGVVTDPNGGRVSGATVTLTTTGTGSAATTQSNTEGFFTFRSLTPGEYSLTIEGAGFSKASVEKVTVQVGTIARADLQMKVGGVGETVNVDIGDTAIQVDTTRQTVDGVINAKQIVNLPLNDRNFLDLAVLQPGVTVVDGGVIDPTKTNTFRAVRVNGGSGTGTRVQIEGIDVTDEVVGTTVANFSTDAVQEFNLARSSFDLSTSLTTSGAVSIASRTGSNQFNGSVFYFKQDDRFDARPGFQAVKPEFNRDQYGYRFGGPLWKDKLFFFSNAERLTQADFTDFGSTNFPTFNGESTLPIETFNSLQRLDFRATSKISLFYLFNHSDDTSTGGTLPSPFDNINFTNIHVAGLNVSGTALTHSIRFGYVNFNNNITSTEISGFPFVRGPGGTPFQVNVGDLSFGPNSLAPQQTYQDNYQGKYDGSWVLKNHVIRFGGEVTRILLGGFANFAGPATLFGDLNNSTGDPNDPLNHLLLDFAIGPDNGFFTARPAHGLPFGGKLNNRLSWYLGDQWKATRNLTINFGVRHNYDTNFFSSEDVPRLPSLDLYGAGLGDAATYPKSAFSPQVGFAWDPTGDGKTSIRGGAYLAYEANIFNNSLFDEFARIRTGIGPTQLFSNDIHDPNLNPIVVNGIPGCAPTDVANGDYTCLVGRTLSEVRPFIEQINNALQAAYANAFDNYDPNSSPSEFDANGGVTFGGQFGGDYKIPYSMQFNLGFQRELARGHVLSVDYVRQRGVGLPLQLLDYEARRDARFFDETAVRTSIGNRIGVAPANVNPTTIQAFLNANPTASISTFALANDTNFPGRTSTNTRARLVVGGFSLYQGVQISLNGRFSDELFKPFALGGHSIIRGFNYTLGYALAKNESTSGGARPEFIANTQDNSNYNSSFGPNGLDRTHNLTISAGMDLIGGFRLDQIYRFSTAPPVSLFIPNFRGSSGIFTSDFNGDGGIGGGAPRGDILPGTNIGDFGRKIRNITALNQVITRYNQDFAGRVTPHGQRLIDAGLFTEAQLRAIGAVTPTIALVPESNPNPFESRFNADFRLSRPTRLGSERFVLEPSFSVFNVFNNNAVGTYGGLTGAFGSLNFNYATAGDVADLREARGLLFRRRQLQFGIRFTF